MTKLDYFKMAIALELYKYKAWLISCFAITRDARTREEPGWLVKQPWGYSYIKEDGSLEPITDSVPNQPLLSFKDRITIDPTWVINVKEPTETTVGNVLFNAICIITAFQAKFPFQTGKVSVKKIEDSLAPLLTDTPLDDNGDIDETATRDPSKIYVDEYIKFIDALQFMSNLSTLTAWSATPKSLVQPDGLVEFKQQLLQKYEGKLTDPVELSKFEQELLEYDRQFLEDDPAYGTFLQGKILHTARKKMFLTIGSDRDFKDSLSVTPVINSLQDGWPTTETEFTAMLNGSRIGSFSRGAETVKGGVSAKILLRAGNNYTIEDTDCQSPLGIRRVFNSKTVSKLVGRYQITSKGPVLIENEEQAQSLLNNKIILRSPMYCRLDGARLCRVCAGEKLFKFPTGITIPLTEISSIILATSLKAMHVSSLTTAKLSLEEHFS